MGLKFSFIGAGRMNRALIQGLVHAKACKPAQIGVATRTPEKARALVEEFGLTFVESNEAAAKQAEIVVFGVKPLDAAAAIQSCSGALSGKLAVSVMSGLNIESLQAMAGAEVRWVRAMPNVAALVGEGATAMSFGEGVTAEDRAAAQGCFEASGKAYEVKESLLDAVTGLSGSGPAYLFLVLEALADGGVKAGLPRDLAGQLAIQTMLGSARLALESGQHPALLREMVTSPGGTTAAALAVLEDRSVRGAFIQAVEAAVSHAKKLGKPESK